MAKFCRHQGITCCASFFSREPEATGFHGNRALRLQVSMEMPPPLSSPPGLQPRRALSFCSAAHSGCVLIPFFNREWRELLEGGPVTSESPAQGLAHGTNPPVRRESRRGAGHPDERQVHGSGANAQSSKDNLTQPPAPPRS